MANSTSMGNTQARFLEMSAKAGLIHCSDEVREVISTIDIRNQIEQRNEGLDADSLTKTMMVTNHTGSGCFGPEPSSMKFRSPQR